MPKLVLEFENHADYAAFMQARQTGSVETPGVAVQNATGQTVVFSLEGRDEEGRIVLVLKGRPDPREPAAEGELRCPPGERVNLT